MADTLSRFDFQERRWSLYADEGQKATDLNSNSDEAPLEIQFNDALSPPFGSLLEPL
jgi:hypothetical protein